MLATPNVLSCPEFVRVEGDVVFSKDPPVSVRTRKFGKVETACGRLPRRNGDAEWKRRAACVDQRVDFGLDVRPISRAFYKLVEVMRTCALDPTARTLHLCDAPGGFAQAVCVLCPSVKEILVTSRRDEGAPLFAASLMRDERVSELDLPHSSNIQISAVRDAICKTVRNCCLITADGAVDNEAQPELTEAVTARLLFHEIMTALRAQTAGGDFVLKVFGISLQITRELIAVLAACYQNTSIVKPFTSRAINDERYIVCQGFCLSAAPFLALEGDYDGTTASAPYLASIGLHIDPSWLEDLETRVPDESASVPEHRNRLVSQRYIPR